MCEQLWKSNVPRGGCPLLGAISTLSGAASKFFHDKRKAPSHFDLRPNKRIASELVEICTEQDRDYCRGYDRDRDYCRDLDRVQNRDLDWTHGRDLDRVQERDLDRVHVRDLDRVQERDLDRVHVRDLDRVHVRDLDRVQERDLNRVHDRDLDRVRDRDYDRGRNLHRNRNHDRGPNRVQERDHRYRERDRILASPERKPRDPPLRQLSEPDPRRLPSTIDRKQWLKELEEDWVRHCTAQWKSDVQKLVHLNVVQADDFRYSCIICCTGKMSLTALMGSHVSGKKHQVLAAKSGIFWHPETPTFKNFKNIILGNRKRPPPTKSLLVPVPLGERCNPPSPQESTIPHVIPKLDRNQVVPLYLKSKTPVEGITEVEVEMELEMEERMAEQLSEQLLSEEMREISETLEIPETLVFAGNSEVSVNPDNSEIPIKEATSEIPEVMFRNPLSFLATGAYPSMCPSGLPLKSEAGETSQMEPCDILSKWNQLQYGLKSTPPSFGLPFSSGWTQQQPEAGQFYWTGEWTHPQQSWVQQMEQQQQHQPD